MALDADAMVDRRRLKRSLTLWRGLAIVLGVAAIIAAAGRLIGRDQDYVARVTVSGLIVEDRERDLAPEMRVDELRRLLGQRYDWALRMDLGQAKARQHFWYHSIDNGEQRRGERIVDPHEEYESFIDHVGLMQRLASALTCYADGAPVAEVVADTPELAFAVSRAQYLAGLPYCEIRGGLVDRDFLPSHLIRFFLAVLGMECTNPLSIRYVRGVFFPGMPLPAELAAGASEDWTFPAIPQRVAAE